MKKVIISLFFVFLLSCKAYSNDAWVEVSGGNYSVVDNQNTNIRLLREKMIIDLYDDHYTVRISYSFHNDGDTITLDIGFPEYSTPNHRMAGLSNFKSYVNGKFVETNYVKNYPYQYGNKDKITTNIDAWYIKQITFNANEDLNSIIEYNGQYSPWSYEMTMNYLYGTASCWKTGIENFTIEVFNHANFWINDFQTKFENYTLKNEDDVIVINSKQIMPKIGDTFTIYLSTVYRRFSPLWVHDTGWYFTKIINENELPFFSKNQLRIVRNSIYAWHGYIFTTNEMNDFFMKQSWYKPNNSFNESMLTQNERRNIELILQEERRRE